MLILRYSYKAILIAILAGALIVSVALGAGSATLRNYQVDFVEVTGTTNSRVWTYAITANGDESAALSEWTLAIDNSCDFKFLTPASSTPGVRSYTTPTSYVLQGGSDYCASHTCQAAQYEVAKIIDLAAGLRKITFKNPDLALASGNPVTHLFQIGIISLGEQRIGDTGVTVDTGGTGGAESGLVFGAVCPPTAVQLVNLTASSSNSTMYLAVLIGIFLAIVGLTGFYILRKKIA